MKDLLHKLEAELAKRFSTPSAAPPPAESAAPVHTSDANEVLYQVLDQVRQRVRMGLHQEKTFPYNFLTVRVAAASAEERAYLEAALQTDRPLEQAIRRQLAKLNCPIPDGFAVQVQIEDGRPDADEPPFLIEYERREAPRPAPVVARPALLSVVKGQAEPDPLRSSQNRIYLGRLPEVVDAQGVPKRRNDLAFQDDGTEVNTTVSREHAYLQRDAKSGSYRLFDLHSRHGTRVYRSGEMLVVPSAPGLGVLLQPEDEIHLGLARVRFELSLEA